jgi:RimJ/RimL family protein N-acetyltransferase
MANLLTSLRAEPFTFTPNSWTELLDKVVSVRHWFDDLTWKDPQVRRKAAAAYLVDAIHNGMLWEVRRGVDLVGIILVNQVHYGITAYGHFIFFDRQLTNKRQLCLAVMAKCFEHLAVETLRVEVPTYAHALIKWLRKKLGFRYEAEARPLFGTTKRLTEDEAALGSRKYRAVLYEGQWHDAVLLSLTRTEFANLGAETIRRTRGTEPEGV